MILIAIYILLFACLIALFFFLRKNERKENNIHTVEIKDETIIPAESAEQPEVAPQTIEETVADDEEAEQITETCDKTPSAAETCDKTPSAAETETETDKKVTQNNKLIAHLHKVLEEDRVFLRPDIHIDDVARMLLTNRTYVTRLMRQEYGLSFIEYVNIARIQYSQQLLYSSELSLDEVAEKSGFQSTSNYCRAFKRYIGSSPLNWLQNIKQ